VAALAAAAVFALPACGVGGGGGAASDEDPNAPVTITFTWWGDEQRANATNKAIELFHQRNPNITVQTSFSGFQAYWDKLATQTAGGSMPDVLQMDVRYLSEYGERGVLRDLDQVVGKEITLDDVNPALADTGKAKGTRYAVPFAQNTSSLMYEPKAWAAGGIDLAGQVTWSQFREAARRVSESTGFQVSGVTDFGGSDNAMEIWLRQHGKGFYTEQGTLGFGAPELTEFWRLTDSFRTSRAATPAELTATINQSPEQAPLGRRLSAAETAYDSVYPASQSANGQPLKLAAFPTDTGTLGQYRRGSMLLSASARSQAPLASAKLINFLINDPEAGAILGTNRGLPPNLKIREQLASTATGTSKEIFDFEAAVDSRLGPAPVTPPKGAGAIQLLFQRTYEEVAFGRLSLDAAVARFFDEAAKDLK